MDKKDPLMLGSIPKGGEKRAYEMVHNSVWYKFPHLICGIISFSFHFIWNQKEVVYKYITKFII